MPSEKPAAAMALAAGVARRARLRCARGDVPAAGALAAAAANYGCPLLFIEGHTISPDNSNYQAKITFTKTDLERRYQ